MSHNARVVTNVLLLVAVLLFVNDAANRWVVFTALAAIGVLLVLDFDVDAADAQWRRTHL